MNVMWFYLYSYKIFANIVSDFQIFIFDMLRRKIVDEYNDEEVHLSKEETRAIQRVLDGKAPHADFDPHAVSWSHLIFFLLYFLN